MVTASTTLTLSFSPVPVGCDHVVLIALLIEPLPVPQVKRIDFLPAPRCLKENEIADQIGCKKGFSTGIERLEDDLRVIFTLKCQRHDLNEFLQRHEKHFGAGRLKRKLALNGRDNIFVSDAVNQRVRPSPVRFRSDWITQGHTSEISKAGMVQIQICLNHQRSLNTLLPALPTFRGVGVTHRSTVICFVEKGHLGASSLCGPNLVMVVFHRIWSRIAN